MKNKLNPLILFCLLTTSVLAQENSSDDLPYKQDIGFSTTFILRGILNSEAHPFTLMYKRYTKPNIANRIGISISVYSSDIKGSTSYNDYSSGIVNLIIGKEKQKQINKNWIWFYGADLMPYYDYNQTTSYQNMEKSSETDYKKIGLNLRPFLAIRYNINSRLYLSAEASITVGYARFEQSSKTFLPDMPQTENVGNNLSIYASPASGLFLYYRF